LETESDKVVSSDSESELDKDTIAVDNNNHIIHGIVVMFILPLKLSVDSRYKRHLT
jgi:hypothetical protein